MAIVFHSLNKYGLLLGISLLISSRDSILTLCLKQLQIWGTTKESRKITLEYVKTLWILLVEGPGEGLLNGNLGVHDEGVFKIFYNPHIW